MTVKSSSQKRVAVVGLGLIGGSLGMALRRSGFAVTGIARREESIRLALKCGAIDKGFVGAGSESLREAEIVVVAIPVGAIPAAVEEIYPHLRGGAIVTDVGSTKAKIVHQVNGFLPKGISFVGGHPVAGSEKSGIASARGDLFENTTCVLTPLEGDNPRALKVVREMWVSAGARIIVTAPEEHDLLMAGTSHLPHLAAVGLMGLLGELKKENENASLVVGSGFRDTTRIALSSPTLWRDICLTNKDALINMLVRFRQRLEGMEKKIRDEDEKGVLCELEEARELRLEQHNH